MSQFRRKLLESYATNKLVYPGLIAAWSAKGKTNEDVDRNVLKDLTGNGHDITLNNFAYSGMSGYGGYKKNFTLINTQYQYCELINEQTIRIYKRAYGGVNGNQFDKLLSTDGIRTIKLKVSGITEENKQNNTKVSIYSINADGDNWETYDNGVFEASYKTTYVNPAPVGIQCSGDTDDNINITVELIPEYPDALVFDGVDDWGISKSLPILTDYTIIVKRVFLDNEKGYSGTVAAKGFNPERLGAFCFERNENTYFSQTSFGESSRLRIEKDVEISWQTTLSYLGKAIHRGNSLDEPTFTIGTAFTRSNFLKGAIYSAYLFDRSLDEQEIKSFIRKYIDPEYLLPSEIVPTPPPTR